ncbi:MAG TPA: hypothetical protein VFV73_18930 [Streptosporangiaceae bacterium]|nr:hypothetical protein [Streptosporangiaceae bacterium]
MLSEHGSAPRRRKSRASRFAVPLAIPAALGLTFGVVMVVSHGGTATTVAQSALGTCASASASAAASAPATAASASAPAPAAVAAASASAPAPAASTSASAAPCPSASASASCTAAATTTGAIGIPPNNPPGRAGAAGSNAVDASGAAFSFTQTTAEAANSANCTVSVPANPLSAAGLATPWELGDGCTWANGGSEGVFIDATILSPNGQLQVYNPLVIDQGTKAAVAPTPPTIAPGSQVILSVGYNGNGLALVGPGIRQGNCIDALGNSLINQTPQCNAANFYRMANAEIARGILKVPATGTGQDGQACQTTRDFALIDQDQSDNAVASYLFDPATGQTAQATAANQAAMTNATVETNGSDNGLLDKFVDVALGCTPFTAPNATSPNGSSSSQALNELSARVNQKGTVALLPVNNPQLLVGGQFSVSKTNLYRIETDQPTLGFGANLDRNAAQYCQNMVNIQAPRLKLDADMEAGTASPVPDVGNNLATFLGARLAGSFDNLNCKNYGLTNPVTVTTDANGVATAVTYNTTPQKAQVNAARGGRHHRPNYRHRFMPGRFGHI